MRKDVLIARITFVILCLAIVGIIVSVATRISGSRKEKPVPEDREEENIGSTDQIPSTEVVSEQEEPVDIPEEPVVVYVKTTKSVNLRNAPNTDSSDVITVLEADQKLTLVSEADGWAEVTAGDNTGYVSMDFLEYVSDDEPEVDPATGTSTVLKKTTDSVRMRTGAGTDNDILMTIAPGITLEILEEVDGWAKVTYQGQTGYVSGDYLE